MCDWNDWWSDGDRNRFDGYGCFQFFATGDDLATGETLFAISGWGKDLGGVMDVGLVEGWEGEAESRNESVRQMSWSDDVERREECAEVAGVSCYEAIVGLCQCAYHDICDRTPRDLAGPFALDMAVPCGNGD